MDLFLQALTQGILVGGTYALIALGMAVIFSVSGMVNFAHGDFLLVGMYLAYSLFAALHLDPYLSVFITFPVMCLAGAGLYAFLLRRLTASNLLMAVQLTLGLSFVVQNTLLLIFGGEPIRALSSKRWRLPASSCPVRPPRSTNHRSSPPPYRWS